MIKEHLWSGIIHRSETGEIRKEDSHMTEVVDYLNKHYEYYPTPDGISDRKKTKNCGKPRVRDRFRNI
jgi:hypothetical protein